MDDVILNKVATIEACIKRIKLKYIGQEKEFKTSIDNQDIVNLNLLRACEASLDIGHRIIKICKLGIPQSSRDVFAMLCQHDWIPEELSKKLQNMVGFRNIAIHDYQVVQLEIVESIINLHLSDFLSFTNIILKKVKSLDSETPESTKKT